MRRRAGRWQAEDAARWRARHGFAITLRLVVLLAPVGVSVAASFAVTRLVPAPDGLGPRVIWLSLVVLLCGLLAWPARRQLRRLLPLAALLELSILFPGEAPTRWKVAREAGSVRHLEVLATGVPETEPVKAATTILALVASLARHDRMTRGHSDRVRVFTDMIGEEMGLPRADRDRLRWAALIHDIGKLEVPAKLLRKPGKPTPSEWESLRLHPETGARLIAPLADWLGAYAAVVVQHHERFDGTGYPAGLRGDQIGLGGRIVGLADAFEVMTAARPYKKAFSRPTALREVVRCSGTHFDPDVVRALLAVSTPRLRRALGPASWIGQIPVVGTAPVGGLPAAAGTVARGAGTVVLGGMASAVVVGSMGTMAGAATEVVSVTQQDAGWASTPAAHHRANPDAITVTAPGGGSGDPTAGDQAFGPASTPTAGSPAAAAAGSPPTDVGGVGPTSAAAGAPGGGGSTSPVVTSGGVGGTSGLQQTVDQATTGLGGTVGTVVGGLGGTVGTVVGGLGDAVGGPLGSTVGGVGDTLGSTVTDLGDTLGSTVTDLGGTVSGLLGGTTSSPGPSAPASPTPSSSPSGLGGLLGKLLGG